MASVMDVDVLALSPVSAAAESPRKELSPDSKCPICLDRFRNVSYADKCFHRFCFCCILEWSKNKAECPLCKQPFSSIYHSVRAQDDFLHYQLRPGDAGSFGSVDGRRFRYRTTLTVERRRETWRVGNQRQQEVMRFRRWLYRRGVRVRGVRDGGRSRETSAEFFRKNPACVHRLVPWLKRELTVLFGPRDSLADVVRHVVLSLIVRHDVQGEVVKQELRPFLRSRTEHFLHEFLSFAKSPFNMEAYDRFAVYDCPAPTHLTSVSEDDEDLSSAPYPWDDETPGPSYSSVTQSVVTVAISDSDLDSDAEEEEAINANTNANASLNEEDESSDDDCIVIGVVKPTAERTPELIQLSSDSESKPSTSNQSALRLPTNQKLQKSGDTPAHGYRMRSHSPSRRTEPTNHSSSSDTPLKSHPHTRSRSRSHRRARSRSRSHPRAHSRSHRSARSRSRSHPRARSRSRSHPRARSRSRSHPRAHSRSHRSARSRSRSHPRARSRSRSHPRAHSRSRSHPRAHSRSRSHPRAHSRSRSHPRAHLRSRSHRRARSRSHRSARSRSRSHRRARSRSRSHPRARLRSRSHRRTRSRSHRSARSRSRSHPRAHLRSKSHRRARSRSHRSARSRSGFSPYSQSRSRSCSHSHSWKTHSRSKKDLQDWSVSPAPSSNRRSHHNQTSEKRNHRSAHERVAPPAGERSRSKERRHKKKRKKRMRSRSHSGEIRKHHRKHKHKKKKSRRKRSEQRPGPATPSIITIDTDTDSEQDRTPPTLLSHTGTDLDGAAPYGDSPNSAPSVSAMTSDPSPNRVPVHTAPSNTAAPNLLPSPTEAPENVSDPKTAATTIEPQTSAITECTPPPSSYSPTADCGSSDGAPSTVRDSS
ncbi:topoisomerase I binding, arginine/serine-rich a [Trichomycterus rosablanca]|uniref:topoisomerase I binding, arginine/serine-rich a n=1 Tax=Trichomycterus rosablanca TaxID=2290929 RepID=UPI002F351DB3